MGGCQNYGPFFGSLLQYGTYYLGYPKRDSDFDNYPYVYVYLYIYIYVHFYRYIHVCYPTQRGYLGLGVETVEGPTAPSFRM